MSLYLSVVVHTLSSKLVTSLSRNVTSLILTEKHHVMQRLKTNH